MRATLLGLTVAMLSTPLSLLCQESSTPPPAIVSVAAGMGFGTPAAGGQASLSASTPTGDFILRFAETSDMQLLQTSETTRDIALLYGRRSRGEREWARAAVGLGHVKRVERGEVEECQLFACRYEEVPSSTLGLALQVDLVWAPSEGFGLGLTGLGNLNRRRSFGALTLTLHAGGVR